MPCMKKRLEWDDTLCLATKHGGTTMASLSLAVQCFPRLGLKNDLLIAPFSLPFRQGSLRDKKRILNTDKLKVHQGTEVKRKWLR